MNTYKDIKAVVDKVSELSGDFIPEIAIVLGSGLGKFADNIKVFSSVKYSNIDGFPVSTVSGHEGRFIFGEISGKKIAAMQGRVHYYEGYEMHDVVLPIRIMRIMGAGKLILTNAAGGINQSFSAGDLMLITGQISQFVPSPLIGPNIDELGPRFPDMSDIYTKRLRDIAHESADKLGISLKQGVYVQASGPNYESPAEISMFSSIGADAVGMSTACEAIAARHMGMEICGISCITNMAAGINPTELSHDEVKITADASAENFRNLVTEIISQF